MEVDEMAEKIALQIIVNGTPALVEANPHAALQSVVGRALELTSNTGQPEQNWEIRDGAGNALDLGAKIDSFGFAPGTRLFLNLKAGVGG
jgi:hypothetical protein